MLLVESFEIPASKTKPMEFYPKSINQIVENLKWELDAFPNTYQESCNLQYDWILCLYDQ